jgi:hypothetical protein
MTTRPFHNKQEKDRHQQKLTRGCQHWPCRHALQGRASQCESVREREADRLLQRLARRCLHCLALDLVLGAIIAHLCHRCAIETTVCYSTCLPLCALLSLSHFISSSTRATRSSPRQHPTPPGRSRDAACITLLLGQLPATPTTTHTILLTIATAGPLDFWLTSLLSHPSRLHPT